MNKFILTQFACIVLLGHVGAQSAENTLYTGVRIFTGKGEVIEKGALGIQNGRITYVGAESSAPRSTYRDIEQRPGKSIYPALIASNTTLGLTEIFAVRATRDYKEVGDMNPNVRALIAYNAESDITPTVLSNGVLFAQICPRGGTISGTSSVVVLKAWNWEDAAYEVDEGIHMDWPRMMKRQGDSDDPVAYEPDEEYEEKLREIKSFFRDAEAYGKNSFPVKRNLKLESMSKVFTGEKRLYIQADFIKEIREAIALKREFNIPKVTIVGGYDAWKAADLLKENGISVLVRRVNSLPRFAEDHLDAPFSLPSKLAETGVKFAFQMDGDMEPIQNRNIAFNAGTAIANGLSPTDALKALTIYPAEILGIADKTGSLETGKEANFIIVEGDIFDMRSGKVEEIFFQGKLVEPENRQELLYEKYSRKYGM